MGFCVEMVVQNEYLKIHQVSEEPFLTHMTFRQIAEFLPSHFLQIHRSYIVNMKHVVTAERTSVTQDDGKRLPELLFPGALPAL